MVTTRPPVLCPNLLEAGCTPITSLLGTVSREKTVGHITRQLLVLSEGINYAVRYIGCVDVNTSMKVLDFETRSVTRWYWGLRVHLEYLKVIDSQGVHQPGV